ncbi:MAG TPA: dTMP kinase [Candidatus Janibacter merdipullorum]|nr:dTMP kinase [Candidatus Janibacter merdipullorum]
MSSREGTFIAFEGGDGAGKSTQVVRLAAALEEAGREVVLTRQPGGTALGAAVRELVLHGAAITPRAEALLFAADKAQHVEEVVLPSLERGAVVITDRYTDSSIAYQGAGRDLGAAEVAELQDWAVGGLAPDLTVLVDIDPGEGRRRRGAEHDRMESEADAFHDRVRGHFRALAEEAPHRYLVVDGSAAPEEIARLVWERVREAGLA